MERIKYFGFIDIGSRSISKNVFIFEFWLINALTFVIGLVDTNEKLALLLNGIICETSLSRIICGGCGGGGVLLVAVFVFI